MNKLFHSGFGHERNSIKVQADSDSNPDKFRFHMSKSQGDYEKGVDGYVSMLEIKHSINNAIKYMTENHKEFTVDAFSKYSEGKIAEKKAKSIFPNDEPEDYDVTKSFEAKNTAVGSNFDSVTVSHTGRIRFEGGEIIYPEREIGNTKISIGKWQGETEVGEQGLIRLFALKDAIEQANKALKISFKDLHKTVQKESGIDFSKKGKEQSLEI